MCSTVGVLNAHTHTHMLPCKNPLDKVFSPVEIERILDFSRDEASRLRNIFRGRVQWQSERSVSGAGGVLLSRGKGLHANSPIHTRAGAAMRGGTGPSGLADPTYITPVAWRTGDVDQRRRGAKKHSQSTDWCPMNTS